MVRAVYAVLALLLLVTVAAAQSYVEPSTRAAQQALARLGYDVGTPDGIWGGRSREAMNAVRAANGLPPADDLSGSSLALLHRLSPGDNTLPHPGLFIADAKARRSELQSRPELAASHCRAYANDDAQFDGLAPREFIGVNGTQEKAITSSDDWFSPLLEGAVSREQACLAGDDKACEASIDFADRWSAADALKDDVPRSDVIPSENAKWITNVILRNSMIAYGIARNFVDVAPEREARILDWFKRRVDEQHYLMRDEYGLDSPKMLAAQNRSLANMTTAMVFGILVGDRAMMQPAIDLSHRILGAIRKDGSLPTEARRGSSWLHYTNVWVGQVLAVAELARAQGIEVDTGTFGERASVTNAVGFILDAMEDLDRVEPYAKANYAPILGDDDYAWPMIRGFAFGWLPSYISLYGADDNVKKLRTQGADPRICDRRSLDGGKLIFPEVCQTGSPLSFANVLLGIDPRATHMMGYSAGCLEAELTWTDMLSVPVETTTAYDGYQCRFALAGFHGGKVTDTFATGVITVAGAEAKFSKVKWSKGLQPNGEDLTGWPLTLTSARQLLGKFPLFYLNNGQEQPDFRVEIDDTNSPVFGDKPEGNVDFSIYEPDDWTGRLRIFSCQR